MSACAGSSTDASRANRSRCRPASLALVSVGNNFKIVPAARVGFSSISPAWSRWIALGRIGFMNTQRGEGFAARPRCNSGSRWQHWLRLWLGRRSNRVGAVGIESRTGPLRKLLRNEVATPAPATVSAVIRRERHRTRRIFIAEWGMAPAHSLPGSTQPTTHLAWLLRIPIWLALPETCRPQKRSLERPPSFQLTPISAVLRSSIQPCLVCRQL